jgi:hypothetical protein
MKIRLLALVAIICTAGPSPSAKPQRRAPYTAIEVDRFVAERGVPFPSDYQIALVEDIAREASLAFVTIIIMREGEAAPAGQTVLRISGTVTRFQPGNKAKRYLIGFGAGATIVQAQVKLTDADTGQVLLNREAKGVTWTGLAGGDSQGAGESLARKIAKLVKGANLVRPQ